MRRLVTWLTVLLMVLALGVVSSHAAGNGVTADGKSVSFDVEPTVVDGMLMVPIRAVAEAMGGKVSWDQGTRTATIKAGENAIQLTVGKAVAQVNGHDVELAAEVVIRDDRLLVPASFLLTVYGQHLNVDYQGLKDPVAMAILEKGQKAGAASTNQDVKIDQETIITMQGPVNQTMPMHVIASGQVRGQDVLMSTTIEAAQVPGGGVTTMTAVRSGKACVKAGTAWMAVPASTAAQTMQSLNSAQALLATVKEAHLGANRTVDGQARQDVAVTYDLAALKSYTDAALKATLADAGPDVKIEMLWEKAGATMTYDTATGLPVSQTADMVVTMKVTAEGETMTMRMVMHQTVMIMPNTQPIAWPADLPK